MIKELGRALPGPWVRGSHCSAHQLPRAPVQARRKQETVELVHPCLLSPDPHPRQPARTKPGGGSGLHKKKKPSNTFQHPLEKRVAGNWSRKKAEREGEVYFLWGKKKEKGQGKALLFQVLHDMKFYFWIPAFIKKKKTVLDICKSQKGMLFVGNWSNER